MAVCLPKLGNADGLAVLVQRRSDPNQPIVDFFPLPFGRREVQVANHADLRLRVPDDLQRHIRRHTLSTTSITLWPGVTEDKALTLLSTLQEFRSPVVTAATGEPTGSTSNLEDGHGP
jgi:hypothetical protein